MNNYTSDECIVRKHANSSCHQPSMQCDADGHGEGGRSNYPSDPQQAALTINKKYVAHSEDDDQMEEEASDSEAPRPISSRTRSKVRKSKKPVTVYKDVDDEEPDSDDERLNDDEAEASDGNGVGATLLTIRLSNNTVLLLMLIMVSIADYRHATNGQYIDWIWTYTPSVAAYIHSRRRLSPLQNPTKSIFYFQSCCFPSSSFPNFRFSLPFIFSLSIRYTTHLVGAVLH